MNPTPKVKGHQPGGAPRAATLVFDAQNPLTVTLLIFRFLHACV